MAVKDNIKKTKGAPEQSGAASMDDTPRPGKSYTLNFPLDLGDKRLTEVNPRRLTGQDILKIEDEVRTLGPERDYGSIGSGERMLRLIGRSCGLKYEDVLLLDATDVNALNVRVNDFL